MTGILAIPAAGAAPLFSVICVYNRVNLLEELLLPSLRMQSVPHELILVDNRSGRFRSCAEALNSAAGRATGDYLMFVHQDVAFDCPDFLARAAAMLRGLPELGAAGVVGISAEGGPDGSLLNAPLLGDFPGRLSYGTPLLAPTAAQTVDELMLIIPARVFRDQPFDDLTCAGWHLYAVDYCLTQLERGRGVYVLPLLVRHDSLGTLDARYFRTLRRLNKKHRGHFARIFTTSGRWSTVKPILLQQLETKLSPVSKGRLRAVLAKLGIWWKPATPPPS